MAKTKTSQKPKKYLIDIKKLTDCRVWDPTSELLDIKRLGRVVTECLFDNDPDGVIEAVRDYLSAVNMVHFSKNSSVPLMTLNNMIKNKNPTLKTLAKVIHGISVELKKQNKKAMQKVIVDELEDSIMSCKNHFISHPLKNNHAPKMAM